MFLKLLFCELVFSSTFWQFFIFQPGRSSGAGVKQPSAKQMAKKEEREKRQAENKHLREVTTTSNMVAKAMPSLTSQVNGLASALKQIEKEGEDCFGEDLVKSLKEASTQFNTWKTEATDFLHSFQTNKVKANPERVSFDKATLETSCKGCVSMMANYKEITKGSRTKKAEEKAAQGSRPKAAPKKKK